MTGEAGAGPAAAGPFPPSEVHRSVLDNGLTVLVRRDRSASAVAVVTYLKAGYFDEPDDVVGIAHLLEHMYFKGTPTRGVGVIAQETKASGGYLNAHTIYDHTSYYTVLPASRFVDGLAIQADAYANSLIDERELGREIEVIIQEVRRKEDSPSAVATEALYSLLHDRHRIRRWRMGRPEQLRGFTRDAVVAFYRHFYRPGNTILTVVGDVDPEDARREVERYYGALPAAPVDRVPGPAEGPVAPGARYREWGGDVGQTQLLLGWRTPGSLHHDTVRLDLAALVLGAGRGSRLYRAVRDRQLASTVSAYNYTPTDLGVFVVHAECAPDRAPEAARALWTEVSRLARDGVEDHELMRAQRVLESRWVRRAESMEGQASYLAEWEALGDWRLGDDYLSRALAARPDEVTEVIRRYAALPRVGVIVYRPASDAPLADGADALLAPRGVAPAAPLEALEPAPATGPLRSLAPARFEREESGVRVYRTTAGVPILVRHKPGAPVLHAGVYTLGGARDESPSVSGVSLLTVRTALKGAGSRNAVQLADAVEMLGGTIGATAHGEHLGWSISVPARFAAPALQLLGDVAQQPLLPELALETERAQALAEHVMLRDDMYRYPVRLATQAAYRDHPYGIGPLGTEASLRRITLDDVRGWHASHVLDAAAVVAVVGDVDPDAAATEAARAFDGLRMGAAIPLVPPTWPLGPIVRVEEREKAQTAVALAFPAPGRGSDDRTAAELTAVVASGLGGRFFDELRDRRSLAYTVHAMVTERAAGGMFVGYIATSPDKEATAREGLLAEFAKVCEDGVTSDELRNAQAYAVGMHAIGQQSGATVLAGMIDAWLFGQGLGELDHYDARIGAVTTDSLTRVARHYFDPSRVVQGIVRGKS